MNLPRIMRHFLTGQLAVKRLFPAASLTAIEQAIKQSEKNHCGEICFAVEASLNTIPLLRNQNTRERAIEVFSKLRIWDTENNNGVLIYLLLADHDVEIIADRGINSKVSSDEWESICHDIEIAFRQQRFEAGVIEGIKTISNYLREHFPPDLKNPRNELTDKPVIVYWFNNAGFNVDRVRKSSIIGPFGTKLQIVGIQSFAKEHYFGSPDISRREWEHEKAGAIPWSPFRGYDLDDIRNLTVYSTVQNEKLFHQSWMLKMAAWFLKKISHFFLFTRKSDADIAQLYNVSEATISRVVAAHR